MGTFLKANAKNACRFGKGRDAPNGDFVAIFTLKPEYSLLALRFICILFNRSRENIDNKEGQSNSYTMFTIMLVRLQKAFEVTLYFNHKGPL